MAGKAAEFRGKKAQEVQSIAAFLDQNQPIVLYLAGASFIGVALALATLERRRGEHPLLAGYRLLAVAFAAYGLALWFETGALLAATFWEPAGLWVLAGQVALEAPAFLLLAWFGSRALVAGTRLPRATAVGAPLLLGGLWIAAVAYSFWVAQGLLEPGLAGAGLSARYLLGVPGPLLASAAFWRRGAGHAGGVGGVPGSRAIACLLGAFAFVQMAHAPAAAFLATAAARQPALGLTMYYLALAATGAFNIPLTFLLVRASRPGVRAKITGLVAFGIVTSGLVAGGLAFISMLQLSAAIQARNEAHHMFMAADALESATARLTDVVRLYLSTGAPSLRETFLQRSQAANYAVRDLHMAATSDVAPVLLAELDERLRRVESLGEQALTRHPSPGSPEQTSLEKELDAARQELVSRAEIVRSAADMADSRARERLNSVTQQSLGFAIALMPALAATLVVAMALARKILQSMAQIHWGARSLQQGQVPGPLVVQTGDELEEVAAAFNSMARSIQAREKELRELNATLEQRVEERTGELSEAYQGSERLAQQLLEAERVRTQFVNIISHELRTPLTVLLGYTELLGSRVGSTPPELLAEYTRQMATEGQRLRRHIETLLTVAALERGETPIRKKHVPIDALVAEVAEVWRPQALEQGLELVAHWQPDLLAMGDDEKLASSLGYLLDNAVRFTPPGGRIVLRATRHGTQILLSVSDTGAGIPQDRLETVFQDFTQADMSDTRTAGGMGLGLGLCRRIVSAHGGTITVRSEVGKGSTFTISLPAIE